MSGRRLDVTAVQAISSMLATLTGAVAASGLGIAGTLIGAGLMSLASTVGAAVYKHYIARGNERLRAAAASLAPHAATATTDGARRAAAGPDGNHAAPTRTRAEVALSRGDSPPGLHAPPGRNVASVLADADRDTVDFPPVGPPDPGGSARAEGAAGSGRPGAGPRWSRRRWLVLAGTALGVFVIAMGVVTAFEAVAGKPLETVVWHRHATGTTIGGLVGGGQHGHRHRPAPGRSPSPTGSPGPTTTAPSTTPSSSPPGSSSPAPSGSVSPTAPASPSPGTSSPAAPTTQGPSTPPGTTGQAPAG